MAGQKSKNYNGIPWKDLVVYDETSPSFLRWKIKIPRSKRNIGDVAGYINNSEGALGYTMLKYNKKLYKAHRIIWILHNHFIEENMYIDHANGVRHDNNLENLKLVTESENNRSRKKSKSNKTGITGVSLTNNRGIPSYLAHWRNEEGKKMQKWFSCSKHGEDVALELAVECRNGAIDILNSQGLTYSDRHGL